MILFTPATNAGGAPPVPPEYGYKYVEIYADSSGFSANDNNYFLNFFFTGGYMPRLDLQPADQPGRRIFIRAGSSYGLQIFPVDGEITIPTSATTIDLRLSASTTVVLVSIDAPGAWTVESYQGRLSFN